MCLPLLMCIIKISIITVYWKSNRMKVCLSNYLHYLSHLVINIYNLNYIIILKGNPNLMSFARDFIHSFIILDNNKHLI